MPDYSVVINPDREGESYILVMLPDGGTEQYRLDPIPGRTADDWVVAVRQKGENAPAYTDASEIGAQLKTMLAQAVAGGVSKGNGP